MAVKVKDRDLVQVNVYLKPKPYERFSQWRDHSGIKSESEALLRCPPAILFPEEYNANAIEARNSLNIEEIEKIISEQVAARLEALNPSPTISQSAKVRWLSTREAFEALEDSDISFDRFRRLTDSQLRERFNLVADRSRRIQGSNHSRWLHFDV